MSERISQHDGEGDLTARDNTPWLGRYAGFLIAGQLAIELGCGLGHDAAQLTSAGLRVVAFDRDLAALSQARIVAPAASFVLGDLTQGLPFRARTADLVVASLSLHYFDRQTTIQILAEAARVMLSGRPFLIRVNAVGDINFGYGQGTQIEPGLFRIPAGRLKRFFTDESLRAVLTPRFEVRQIESRAILQRGTVKRTLECLAICR